jgi:uncharacterized protein YecA (UPF0149 family)
VATSIFRVTVTRQPADPGPDVNASLAAGAAALSSGNGQGTKPAVAATTTVAGGLAAAPVARNVRESLGDEPVAAPASAAGAGAGSPDGPRPGYTPTGERIGRNDPCWCGSGAKYKKCHGR